MTIQASEVKVYRSAEVSDAITNGGKLSTNEVVSNVAGNIFPDVPQSERIAGSTKYRKVFVKVASPNDETLFNTFLYLDKVTAGDDIITIFPADQTDTQNDITGSEDHYGVGQLDSSVLAGVNSIDVLVEDDSIDRIFRIGDKVRISDKVTADLVAGNEEYRTLTSVSYSGNVATLGFADNLANAYASANTYVASGLEVGNIVGSFSNFVVTSSAGSFDDTGSPVVVDSIGGVEDTWTLTFTSATEFDVVGADAGSVGSGTVAAGVAPNNADFSAPYWTLPSSGFSGTFVSGDTIVFTTSPAAKAVWEKRTVPAGAAAIAGNFIDLNIIGENV